MMGDKKTTVSQDLYEKRPFSIYLT